MKHAVFHLRAIIGVNLVWWFFCMAINTLLPLSISFAASAQNTLPAIPLLTLKCGVCHGKEGISSNPAWPNLAGQHASYLKKQLQAFRTGKTHEASIMNAFAAALTNQDIHILATWYARLKPAEKTTPVRYLKRGEQLYRGGDPLKAIPACIACHGPRGRGNAQAGFPVLSGQNAEYTISQLSAFKIHKRRNDLNAMMQGSSRHLNDEDQQAVAYYIQGLH